MGNRFGSKQVTQGGVCLGDSCQTSNFILVDGGKTESAWVKESRVGGARPGARQPEPDDEPGAGRAPETPQPCTRPPSPVAATGRPALGNES
jgi:hypothetical protein